VRFVATGEQLIAKQQQGIGQRGVEVAKYVLAVADLGVVFVPNEVSETF